MMPYDSYQLYQVERAKSPAEIRHADEQGAGWHPPRHRCSVASRGPGEPGGGRSGRAARPARPA